MSDFTMKRLQKEYRQLIKNPLPLMTYVPNPDNMLQWYYIMKGEDGSDYEGGYYFGRMDFKADYPKSAPAIRMITPSGRFEPNMSICMTMTEYYRSLNPTWSAKTLLLGLQSFFYDENDSGAGVIRRSSSSVRKELAAKSMEFNNNNKEFKRVYPEMPEIFEVSDTSDQKELNDLQDKMKEGLTLGSCQKGSGRHRSFHERNFRGGRSYKIKKIKKYLMDFEMNKMTLQEFKMNIKSL